MALRFIILVLLILAASSSKEVRLKESLPMVTQKSNKNTNGLTLANLVYNETFEYNSIFPGLRKQFGTGHAFSIVTSPVFEGSKAGRFELRDSDPEQSGGTRSEVLYPIPSNLDNWYSFSVYFPAADYAKDSFPEAITQWHQGGGISPPLALEIQNDRYLLVLSGKATGSSQKKIKLGSVTKGVWNQFAFRIRHSTGSDGLIEVYLNGQKIRTRNGANMYSLSTHHAPRWKVGIYKWKWNGSATTDTKKRVLYFDNVRMGDANATLAEMTSMQIIK